MYCKTSILSLLTVTTDKIHVTSRYDNGDGDITWQFKNAVIRTTAGQTIIRISLISVIGNEQLTSVRLDYERVEQVRIKDNNTHCSTQRREDRSQNIFISLVYLQLSCHII